MDARIWGVLSDNAHLAVDPSSLSEDADLYRAGVSSLSTVNVCWPWRKSSLWSFPTTSCSEYVPVGRFRFGSVLQTLTSPGE